MLSGHVYIDNPLSFEFSFLPALGHGWYCCAKKNFHFIVVWVQARWQKLNIFLSVLMILCGRSRHTLDAKLFCVFMTENGGLVNKLSQTWRRACSYPDYNHCIALLILHISVSFSAKCLKTFKKLSSIWGTTEHNSWRDLSSTNRFSVN